MANKLQSALLAAALLALPAAPALAQSPEDVKDRAADLAASANELQTEAGALANDVATAEREGEAARAGDGDGNENARAATDDRDGDGFDWGLLGLLGLAGLLGLKRRDDHVATTDTRRDNRL